MTWTDTKQAMPDDGVRVLCVTRKGLIKVLWHKPGWNGSAGYHDAYWCGDGANSTFERVRNDFVTHWMPLPEAPNVQYTPQAAYTHLNKRCITRHPPSVVNLFCPIFVLYAGQHTPSPQVARPTPRQGAFEAL